MASRGMGDINPSKMPKAVRKKRRDNTDFTQYAEGGGFVLGHHRGKRRRNNSQM